MSKCFRKMFLLLIPCLFFLQGPSVFAAETNDSYLELLVEKKQMMNETNSWYARYCKEIFFDNTISNDQEYVAYRSSLHPKWGTRASWEDIEPYIDVSDSVSVYDRDYFIQVLSCIPRELLNVMLTDGYRFRLVKEEEMEGNGDENLKLSDYISLGTTNFDTKEIRVNADGDLMGTTLHEVGHVLLHDYGLDEVLLEHGITSYKDCCFDVYDHFNPSGSVYIYWNYDEVVSDLFAEYVFYPLELKTDSPTLYACYEEALDNMAKK